ncbi:hypothetical protein ACFGVS_09625 [Mucilaginibacter sp. AW1-7]|uniref:hypothetical protein n=1 Tax=unclassified Mucilaginibacter TaxID=2617802 RepID=UPI002366AF2A|nr:hypothetical protein [Mucilaginibacter sp. KACC 22773]WDF80129.1 hypothetical protein PQ469_08935 [Mucilaginibacter sp. KACC 22773]
MQVYNIEIKNVLPILTDLVESIRNFNDSQNIYLSRTYDGSTPGPGTLKKAFGIKEAKLPEFLTNLGVRSLTLSSPYAEDALSRCAFDVGEGGNRSNRWSEIKSEKLIADLSDLFRACRTIAFDDWANVANSSDLWNGLLSDVIRPLQKNDLEFIFYLGDPAKRLFFQVDEILDIISEFSKHGRVTFCLDESEAVKLWMVLNGERPDNTLNAFALSDLKRKYFSIFKTMTVDQLLIYSVNDALVYSEDQQFVLTRKVVDYNIEIARDARDNFIAGFTIGLILQLDIRYCIALGLIVFGSRGENNSSPDKDDLLAYIEKWIIDLNKEDAISLYQ